MIIIHYFQFDLNLIKLHFLFVLLYWKSITVKRKVNQYSNSQFKNKFDLSIQKSFVVKAFQKGEKFQQYNLLQSYVIVFYMKAIWMFNAQYIVFFAQIIIKICLLLVLHWGNPYLSWKYLELTLNSFDSLIRSCARTVSPFFGRPSNAILSSSVRSSGAFASASWICWAISSSSSLPDSSFQKQLWVKMLNGV